ncbi:MAG: N-acetylmuramoyl-L-alanine amidase [Planctomycetes bacterium]|nr:N-acetylmuramoyl-L-alanine amidase [Planctomycetota bacterium]
MPHRYFALLVPLWICGCAASPVTPTRTDPATPSPGSSNDVPMVSPRRGDEIVVCGERIPTGTRVVLFQDPDGFDAYRPHRFFEPTIIPPVKAPDRVERFGKRKGLPPDVERRVDERGWTRDDLERVIEQVVLHYDAAGTSWTCFKILHDVRGLSCHFLLDVDGTVYQTLDLSERAWHAGVANDASIGIEIAHIGARLRAEELDRWYSFEEGRAYYQVPRLARGRLPEEYVGEPARSGIFEGKIHGRTYFQYDFTEAQYVALEKLLRTLVEIFPRIEPRIPLDAEGEPLREALPDDARGFRGIIGHYHVTDHKQDPGPAFDWRRIERAIAPDGR